MQAPGIVGILQTIQSSRCGIDVPACDPRDCFLGRQIKQRFLSCGQDMRLFILVDGFDPPWFRMTVW
jgi:hypothetical protein